MTSRNFFSKFEEILKTENTLEQLIRWQWQALAFCSSALQPLNPFCSSHGSVGFLIDDVAHRVYTFDDARIVDTAHPVNG